MPPLSRAEIQRNYRERRRAFRESTGDLFGVLSRAGIVFARHAAEPSTPSLVHARRAYAGDYVVEVIVRAASSPAATKTTGWADLFSKTANTFLASLAGVSAGAELLTRVLQVRFDGAGAVSLPRISKIPATFVGQAKPIPVVQFAVTSTVQLVPHKLALISVLPREMIDSSNAEPIVRAALTESAAYGLDAVLFSNSAASDDAPAGLLNGVTASTPSTATPLSDAMFMDLSALGGAVARVADRDILFVAAPEQALAIALQFPSFDYLVLTSQALAAKTVIAVAAPALVSGFDPAPTIEASRQTELQMDTAPVEIVSPGGTLTYPTGTMFQSDNVALKMLMRAAWTLRSQNAIAFMSNVSW